MIFPIGTDPGKSTMNLPIAIDSWSIKTSDSQWRRPAGFTKTRLWELPWNSTVPAKVVGSSILNKYIRHLSRIDLGRLRDMGVCAFHGRRWKLRITKLVSHLGENNGTEDSSLTVEDKAQSKERQNAVKRKQGFSRRYKVITEPRAWLRYKLVRLEPSRVRWKCRTRYE